MINVTEDLLQGLSDEFTSLCNKRLEVGAEEYGPLNFLEVDLPTYIYEELADMANYARMLFMRVRILEEAARERGIDLSAGLSEEAGETDQVPYGPTAFDPSAAISGFLPKQK